MGIINIRKRGNKYQYGFEVGKVNGKRKQITKCGFKTKKETELAGIKAYEDYINGGINVNSNMSYAEYLDFWMEEYYEKAFKYSTAKRYKETFNTLKEELGKYKLVTITPYMLNNVMLKLAEKSKTKEGLRNYQKVIKSSLRDATYHFGFLKVNPACELKLPNMLSFELKKTK